MNATHLDEQLGIHVRDLCADSRRVSPDAVYVAYPGEEDDGRYYIQEAITAGAAGVLWEEHGFHWRDNWNVPNAPVVNLRDQLGHIANYVYDAPSAKIPTLALTGTNGKTTTARLIAQLLESANIQTGVIGTMGYGRLNALTPAANTTPSAITLQKTLAGFVDDGMSAAVVEASSHGIRQGRLAGSRFAVAVFTNAGRDHLDYHNNLQDYWQAKAALFEMPDIGACVLNADDAFCAELADKLQAWEEALERPVRRYGKTCCGAEDLRLLGVAEDARGCRVDIDGIYGKLQLRLPFGGLHNVYNFLAAALAVAANPAWAFNADMLARAAPLLTLPAGRLQRVYGGNHKYNKRNAADNPDNSAPAVYVDYAHTPDAMAAALAALRTVADARGGRLLAVFGAGGERDREKRAGMAQAATAADGVIITDDNPRNESAEAIRDEIAVAYRAAVSGAGAAAAQNIGDRREAINAAVAQADVCDVVAILGKGHEATQQVGDELREFCDYAAAQAALSARAGKQGGGDV